MNGKILLDTNAVIYALNAGLILPKADYCVSIYYGDGAFFLF